MVVECLDSILVLGRGVARVTRGMQGRHQGRPEMEGSAPAAGPWMFSCRPFSWSFFLCGPPLSTTPFAFILSLSIFLRPVLGQLVASDYFLSL